MNPKILRRHFFVFAALSIVLLYMPPPAACRPSTTLKFAIIPHRSHLGNEQAYTRVIRALEEETGIAFTWVSSRSYGDVIEKLKTGQTDIGYLGGFSYVKAQDAFGVRILARTIDKDGTEFYQSMIVTGKNSGLNSLADLKGKRFAFTDPNSTTGFLFPMAELKKSGMDLNDFAEVLYVKRHANSVLAVYYNQADAGATSSTITDRIDIDFDRLRVLWTSEPIYRGPWVARKNLPAHQFAAVQKALFHLAARADRDEIFKELQTNGFVAGRDSDYDNVRETIKWIGSVKSPE